VTVALHEDEDGTPDGYVVYRIESRWIDHTAQNEVQVIELVGAGATRLALWRFLLELDLVRRVVHASAHVDEPVADVLDDPRQLRVQGVYDQLWLRVIDVPAALSARTYSVDGAVSVAVTDPLFADRSGCWRLEVHKGVASVTRSDDADLVVGSRALASVYLGDRSWRRLAGSGQVEVRDGTAAALADAMFSVDATPQCLTVF
jgi:predicted acetyltransferase